MRARFFSGRRSFDWGAPGHLGRRDGDWEWLQRGPRRWNRRPIGRLLPRAGLPLVEAPSQALAVRRCVAITVFFAC